MNADIFLIAIIVGANLVTGLTLCLRGLQGIRTSQATLYYKWSSIWKEMNISLDGGLARSASYFMLILGALLTVSGMLSAFLPLIGIIVLPLSIASYLLAYFIYMRLSAKQQSPDQ